MFLGHILEVASQEKFFRIKIALCGVCGVLSTFYAKQTNLHNKRIYYTICDSCALLVQLLQQNEKFHESFLNNFKMLWTIIRLWRY